MKIKEGDFVKFSIYPEKHCYYVESITKEGRLKFFGYHSTASPADHIKISRFEAEILGIWAGRPSGRESEATILYPKDFEAL